MKKLIIMIFLFGCALSLFSQKYYNILQQKIEIGHLEYMPTSELINLKLALEKTNTEKPNSQVEENIFFINNTLSSQTFQKENLFPDDSLFQILINKIDKKELIPFYLQVKFLNSCQKQKTEISLIPISQNFYTIHLAHPLVDSFGPPQNRVITFDNMGTHLDQKIMNGEIEWLGNRIIHESFNSLIKYTYTIDDSGKFDKKTPTKDPRNN